MQEDTSYHFPADSLSAHCLQPVDSALRGGSLLLPETRPEDSLPEESCHGVCVSDILSVLCAIACVIFLKRLYCVFPSMAACIFRWKEALALEYSVSLSRDRNLFFVLMVIPLCIVIDRYGIYAPDFLDFLPGEWHIAGVTVCITVFILIKRFLFRVTKLKKTPKETYCAAGGVFLTFFALAAVLISLSAGILSHLPVCEDVIKKVIFYELTSFWVFSLVRKGQIFANNCSIFSTILYLCILEIVPMGLLVASALCI